MSSFDKNVSAIVVLYNSDLVLLQQQFKSLQGQVTHIIYVDNFSNNIDDIELLIARFTEEYSNVYLIRNIQNQGLGCAQNQGILKAKQLGSSYVLLLDHDSVLQQNFVDSAIFTERKLTDSGLKIGAIGPMYFNVKTGEIYPITKYIGPFIKRIKPLDAPVEASFLIASGSLIPISVINEVGGMNEELFVDYIDVEWCFRAKAYGYKLFVAPGAKMDHQIGDKRTSFFGRTISVHTPIRRYYLARNSIYMLKNKNVYFGYKLREFVFNLLRLIVFFFYSKERKKYLKYSIIGFCDGFKGVTGRCSL